MPRFGVLLKKAEEVVGSWSSGGRGLHSDEAFFEVVESAVAPLLALMHAQQFSRVEGWVEGA